MSQDSYLVLIGPIITPTADAPHSLTIYPSVTLIITNNIITTFSEEPLRPEELPVEPIRIPPGQFLHPGFIDTHNHAPQWPMRGMGQGLHILDWLAQVTFPFESRFSDTNYARRTYSDMVSDFLRQGITTASYYGSRHLEATKALADICVEKGQRALVGKCNMDREAPEYLADESAEMSVRETRDLISYIRGLGCPRVRTVVTPRFAICCTPKLLEGLGQIMHENPDVAMQTHFNEAVQEVEYTKVLFPEFKGSEADLYEHYGLLDNRSILAHCTIMNDYETQRIADLKCGVAHCPISNMTVGGGFMVAPIRRYLSRSIKVGLGTDSGGGWSSSMLMVIRQALIASNAQEVASSGAEKALSIDEAFWLATAGGAQVVGESDRIGRLEVGMEFDAVWVGETRDASAMTPWEAGEDLRKSFEKYVMTGRVVVTSRLRIR